MRNRTMIGVAIGLFLSLSAYSQTQPATVLSFPQVADGPNGNTTFTTCINISNPSAAVADIQLQFYNDNGGPLTLTVNIVGVGRRYGNVFNFSVPRNGTVLVMTGGDSPRLQVGWAKATSSVPVAGTLEYSIYDSTFTLYSQAGWGISSGQRNFMISAYNDLALGSTGLAWANPNNGTAIIQATLVNAAGAIVQIKTFVLGPNNHQSAFLSALFERMPANGFTGSVYFSSSVDISPIAVLVSANGLITGLAVVQLAGPPSF